MNENLFFFFFGGGGKKGPFFPPPPQKKKHLISDFAHILIWLKMIEYTSSYIPLV